MEQLAKWRIHQGSEFFGEENPAQKLAKALPALRNTEVTHLDLGNNDLKLVIQLEGVFTGIRDTKITHLDLSSNKLWYKPDSNLASAFAVSKNSSLQSLVLSKNFIDTAFEENLENDFAAIPENIISIELYHYELINMTFDQRRAIQKRFPDLDNLIIRDFQGEDLDAIKQQKNTQKNARLMAQAQRTAEQDEVGNTCPLGNLPFEIMEHINNYAIGGSYPDIFFKNFASPTKADAVNKFLHHVVRGEHEVVCEMLKQDISILVKKGSVIDCSGRSFEHISGFEYALWALDKHMWRTMLECLPQNEKRKEALTKLRSQYHQIDTEGISYWLHGKKFTEKHFNFETTIIKALQARVNLNAPETKDWDAIDKQWEKDVGGAQQLLPMHVVYEYCSPVPFYPIPKFTTRPHSLNKYYNCKTRKYENWFSANSKLGIDFAVFKGYIGQSNGMPNLLRGWAYEIAGYDLAAMKELCKRRTMDFIFLELQLEKQIIKEQRLEELRLEEQEFEEQIMIGNLF
ncbi:leucine-rich repeat domain-containing protein [Legionella clemsonensis]|nr:hypothetical protein [Legionella clemsonensis]